MVRLDAVNLGPIAGNSAQADQVKVVARAHQWMVWSRQRETVLSRPAAVFEETPRVPGYASVLRVRPVNLSGRQPVGTS